jgi:uncharacterized protein (TIGR02453 family)
MERYFSPDLFKFLKDLAKNNKREWFQPRKQVYESVVRDPALRFIAHFAIVLPKVAPGYISDPRPSGGSLFRIYRDTRFSKDKTPYKTHIGIQFRHRFAGRDAHAPGFYFQIEPGDCCVAGGIWQPDTAALQKIRKFIVEHPKEWKKVRRGFSLWGESLKRPPRGFDPNHPLIEDLKRKDFIIWIPLTPSQICGKNILNDVASACRKIRPLADFLTRALELS